MMSSIADGFPAARQTSPSPANWNSTKRTFLAFEIPGANYAARAARNAAKQLLRDTPSPLGEELIADVCLAISELVTNAIWYTASGEGGQVRVELEIWPAGMRVAVIDEGPRDTPCPAADPYEERGNGLVIVEALAAEFGVDVTETGRRTWALIA